MLGFDAGIVRRNIVRYLWEKIKSRSDDNIRAIGFGIGMAGGEIDLERPFCVRAYVKKKKTKSARWKPKLDFTGQTTVPIEVFPRTLDKQQVVSAFSLPVKSMKLVIPTDVCEVGDLIGTGGHAILDDDNSVVTTGTVVRWKVSNSVSPKWGVLTVAHGYDRRIDAVQQNDITIIEPVSGRGFRAGRIAEIRATTSRIDLTLIQVEPSKLLESGLVGSLNAHPLRVRTYSELATDGGMAGTVTQAEGRRFGFSVVGIIENQTFDGVGEVSDLVHVIGPPNAFVGGTSGSPFSVSNVDTGFSEPAAIQVGAKKDTGFRDGYGQSLETSLRRLASQISESLPAGEFLESPIQVMTVF